ncbi:GNAT family N-acetyltransferase [Roseomonas sp. GC11]|uniref:GNAT family N-acetyltransferase n=1 Tax=Roseomonas sp. GC11 TaxID=2950546 RepID=UPI00210CA27E|nr:GNAT family N-acetyltransferase [Roseomonas sp. GC11]MCQ4161598.1 GNAT family N-acetyltransferase [Roseomonas sp. GC11]
MTAAPPPALPPSSGGATLRRLAGADSLAELTRLLHRAYAPLAAMGLRFMATHQSEAVTRERAETGECWVAVDAAGALVGTLLFKDAARTGGTPWLDRPEVAGFGQFAVAPEWQGTGLGARLMEIAERRARETGAREIALDTAEPAAHLIALYHRRGYRLVGHAQWAHTNYRSVIMSKALPPGAAGDAEGVAA